MSKLFEIGYYDENDLKDEGFKSIGTNVKIAKNCTLVGVENISIGNNVKIDEYSIIIAGKDGDVNIGSYVQIGSSTLLIGGDGIVMEDFSQLLHGSKVFSRADDTSGEYMVNPLIPEKFTNVNKGRVILKKHSVVGTNCVVLPDVVINEGAVVDAFSVISKSLGSWQVYARSGRKIGQRSSNILELEKKMLQEL